MFRAAVMVFLVVCLCATGAFAENRAGAITLSPMVGGFNMEQDMNHDMAWTYGLALGYNITEKLGVELAGNFINSGYNNFPSIDKSGSPNSRVGLFRLDMLYFLTGTLPGDTVVPYLAAGVGMERFYDYTRQSYPQGVNAPKNDFIGDAGGGVEFFLTKDLALRGDVRYVINKDGAPWFSNLLYQAGLTFEIGGQSAVKEEAPAPAPEPAPAPVVTPPPPPPAKEQGAIIFRNILFDFDKSNIKPESYPVLDEVAEYLKANPKVKMEIQGHTDGKGKAAYNLKLSDRRAESVKKYLVDKGIAADRLETKGYGLTKPVAPNDTEENRARNRRVEFKPIQ